MRRPALPRPRGSVDGLRIVLAAVVAFVLTAGGIVPAAVAAPSGADALAAASADTQIKPATLAGFNPENLIDDALFYDGAAMTAAEIQRFLDDRNRCTNTRCINTGTASISSRAAVVSHRTGNVVCNAIEGGTMRISELIYRVQVACGISAKVIIVTLEKEQSLVTGRTPTERNLNFAMGANCPDTAPCDPAYSGIGPQILAGTTSLKNYSAGRFARQPGVHFIGYHPSTSCGGTNLNVSNYATAALYNYTPYQPNAAALAAGYGIGDSCSSYGNRNFVNFYTDWFGASSRAGWPFGNVEVVEPIAGGFRVVGWAADPDTKASIQVHVYVGSAGIPFIASLDRPDVAAAFPNVGAAHGFDVRVPANPGEQVNVCVYGINVGVGQNTLLSCSMSTPVTGPPLGSLDAVVPVEGGVRVSGWSLDPDTTNPGIVHLYVDDLGYSMVATSPRRDLATLFPRHGGNRGFDIVLGATPGPHRVCAYGIDSAGGVNTNLGCRDVTVQPLPEKGRAPFGAVDAISAKDGKLTVSGWAIDPDTADSISVHVYVNGVGTALRADQRRPDVGRVYASYGQPHGYTLVSDIPDGQHSVCVYAIDSVGGLNTVLGCKTIVYERPRSAAPFGNVEMVALRPEGIRVSGWVMDRDAAKTTPVHVYVDDAGQATDTTIWRADVNAAFGGPSLPRGFDITLPAGSSGTKRVCVYGINDAWGPNALISCTSVVVP
ncbi:hypothetical protein RYJ27_08900 [Microbacterium limosum]|uniref:Uncharacterized protein n=1 Tax=Microbacterium limosum TaxID=3079935 RepID=A0AAU0MEH9_9MICO|nr:hypothetical protein [Microbacterium sp. Y20]WOQ68827.1 hypothetical protein RYJ27_08900 [Microbacterium sp. Y20]